MAFDVEAIEKKIDHVTAASIELSDEGSGIAIKRLVDAMEIAKLMAVSKQAVPMFMRGEPGLCYACVVRAVRWGMDPFFVAEQSYLVKNPKNGEERIAFMAQLIVAVINARAPLEKKLRAVYSGEGDDMKCTIYGIPKGETEALEYETPTLKQLIAIKGRNEAGFVKGSPLYDNDAKQALWYYGARGFCRRHFPEVLGGVYDRDEFEPIKDVTPTAGLQARLADASKNKKKRRGFDPDHVEREAGTVIDQANGKTTIDNDQYDLAIEVARRMGAEAGPGAPPPEFLRVPERKAELDAWIEGNHVAIGRTGDGDQSETAGGTSSAGATDQGTG